MHTYIRTYIRNFKLLDFSRRWVQVGGGTSSFCSYFEGWSPVGPCDGWKFKFLCFFSRLLSCSAISRLVDKNQTYMILWVWHHHFGGSKRGPCRSLPVPAWAPRSSRRLRKLRPLFQLRSGSLELVSPVKEFSPAKVVVKFESGERHCFSLKNKDTLL